MSRRELALTVIVGLLVLAAAFGFYWWLTSTPSCTQYPDGSTLCQVWETPFKKIYYYQ